MNRDCGVETADEVSCMASSRGVLAFTLTIARIIYQKSGEQRL